MPKHQKTIGPKYLTPQKASDYIGVGATRLLALLLAKKIKGKRDHNARTYLNVESLDDYMATLPDTCSPLTRHAIVAAGLGGPLPCE